MNGREKIITKSISSKMTIREQILMKIFKKFTLRIYIQGFEDGMNWLYENCY